MEIRVKAGEISQEIAQPEELKNYNPTELSFWIASLFNNASE